LHFQPGSKELKSIHRTKHLDGSIKVAKDSMVEYWEQTYFARLTDSQETYKYQSLYIIPFKEPHTGTWLAGSS
jgi:hypothetical protein